VQCFVANAVTTGLTQPRYGMTVAQFHDYGVSVTKILQSDQTYLVLVGLSSAIVNALPQKKCGRHFQQRSTGCSRCSNRASILFRSPSKTVPAFAFSGVAKVSRYSRAFRHRQAPARRVHAPRAFRSGNPNVRN
jgi:hypothetical protein